MELFRNNRDNAGKITCCDRTKLCFFRRKKKIIIHNILRWFIFWLNASASPRHLSFWDSSRSEQMHHSITIISLYIWVGGPQIIKGYNVRGQLTPPAALIPSRGFLQEVLAGKGRGRRLLPGCLVGGRQKASKRWVEQLNSEIFIRMLVSGAAHSDLGLMLGGFIQKLWHKSSAAWGCEISPAPGGFGKRKGRQAGVAGYPKHGRDLGWTDAQRSTWWYSGFVQIICFFFLLRSGLNVWDAISCWTQMFISSYPCHTLTNPEFYTTSITN